MNSAWASSRFTRWKDRPRCQSDVCRILKTPLRPACFPLLRPWTQHRTSTVPALTTDHANACQHLVRHGSRSAVGI